MRTARPTSLLVLATILALGLFAALLAAEAQPAGRGYRIGIVSSGRPEQEVGLAAGLREALRKRGWVEGQNLRVDWRYARADYERT